MPAARLILASSSPRRKDILEQIGFQFETVPVNIDEASFNDSSPEKTALKTAEAKALSAGEQFPRDVIIAADTIVVLGSGAILGKPAGKQDAKEMLQKLSGNEHTVITAVAVYVAAQDKIFSAYDKSRVRFLPMSEEEIEWYVSTGEPLDKAGAYGMQEKGMLFVQSVDGSAATVIGLPVHILYQLLKKAKIDIKNYIK